MNCKLCKENNGFIEAHIIPKAFFPTETVGKLITNEPNIPPKRSQIGVYDKEILCSECEKKFQHYDNYAISQLKSVDDSSKPTEIAKDTQGYNISFDYNLLKLFFISLLWRAGASNMPFYKEVKLGPHEEILRQMILKNDPGGHHNYSVIGWKFNKDPRTVPMIGPWKKSFENVASYYFVFWGFKFSIKAASHNYSDKFTPLLLRPENPWPITLIDYNSSGYRETAKRIAQSQKYTVF